MADEIRLTLPDDPVFADVAAETAATVALRVGFSPPQVDRLRDEVSAAFVRAARSDGGGKPVVVSFTIGKAGVTVQFGEGTGMTIHLRRRGPR
jgi:hypothetical protein